MRPLTEFSIGPGAVIEGDAYLMPGDVDAARAVAYALHQAAVPVANLAAPFGVMDTPAANATLSGASYSVSGWAIGSVPISTVNLYVDGTLTGAATLGVARPDVVAAYPTVAPANPGWQYLLDTTKLTNGTHAVSVHIVDASNTETPLPAVSVTVAN
jgi:hypothetical protein